MNGYHRCYLEVDLEAIAHNIKEVKKRIPPAAKVLAVIKMDAYGHGAVAVAKRLLDEVDFYAVATIEEAIELRTAGIKTPIVILGYISPVEYEDLINWDVSQTIFNIGDAKKLSETAVRLGKTAKIHLAADTGMGRIGYIFNETSVAEIHRISELSGIRIEGMFTHFSCADMADKAYSKKQTETFCAFVDRLRLEGIEIPIVHMCNSAGIMEFDDCHFDMVRSGIITYGLQPSDEVDMGRMDLRPALAWKCHVVHVKEVPVGTAISYGATYVAAKTMRIATVSAGYGDGYPRSLSSAGNEPRGFVLVHGKYAPIVGRVCMDQFMIDVSSIPQTAVEDTVTLIGCDGENRITAEDVAAWSGRFNYELVCDINKRVERIYD